MSYMSPSAPDTRKKLFLLDKTCEMQIFRPQIIIVLNFNQKTLLDKTCQVLCVLDSFYPSTSSTTAVSVPIPQSLRDTSYVVPGVQILYVFKLLCRISRWKPGYTRPNPVFVAGCRCVCVRVLLLCVFIPGISRAGEAKNTCDIY